MRLSQKLQTVNQPTSTLYYGRQHGGGFLWIPNYRYRSQKLKNRRIIKIILSAAAQLLSIAEKRSKIKKLRQLKEQLPVLTCGS
jgi:hypothetical protein